MEINPVRKDLRLPCIPKSAFSLILAFPLLLSAGSHDPFSAGFSMGNGGAIMQTNGPSGRQPWVPACFYADTLRFGFSVCGIDYYDPMDNFESSHIAQALAGGWYRYKGLVCKASYAYLQAFGMYNEQQGYFSAGTIAIPFVNTSVEITGYRAGLMDDSREHASFVHAGVSVLVPTRYAAFSLSCGGLPLKKATDNGFDPPPAVSVGLHTRFNGIGAQGAVCEISKEGDYAFRFSVGEEYSFNNCFSVSTALSTNPFMLHFGMIVSWSKSTASLAFVHNPVLGWSKGLTFDWAR
jgi:hypothetical protein